MPRPRLIAAVAGIALVPLAAGGFIIQGRAERDSARLLDQVLSYVSARFVDTLGTSALYEKAAKGLVRELNDPYTVLFTPKEATAFTTQTNGRYGGIGMLIGELRGQIVVDKVFPHTPAEEADVGEGDRIVRIDTASTSGWKIDQVSNTLRGEPGTRVRVTFSRPGVAEPIVRTFTRRVVRIPAVPYAIMLDGGIGYIPLQQFNETTTQEVSDAVARLTRAGAKGVILDLRDNPGGILEQSLETSNLFLPRGREILTVRGRSERQSYVAEEAPIAPSIPLVVMVDGGSASASEIVAGALQDHDRALLVGTTSYGKGLVQSLYQLDGGYFLKMTTARYYLPSGRSIQKERKIVDGRFVGEEQQQPDSLEADSVKRTRPTFRSASGRTVYGGGGVTPDVIVKADTISTAEQLFVRSMVPKAADYNVVLRQLAQDFKSRVSNPGYRFDPAWREELWTRLQAAGIRPDRAQFDAARPWVDRQIDYYIARYTFGDSTVRRRTVVDDRQLQTALDLLRRNTTQAELLASAARSQAAVRERE